MVKVSVEVRIKAVLFHAEDLKETKDICEMYGISERTLRRWARAYKDGGLQALEPRKPGPKHSGHSIPTMLEQRIVRLKQKHPSWGARRIKYQAHLRQAISSQGPREDRGVS